MGGAASIDATTTQAAADAWVADLGLPDDISEDVKAKIVGQYSALAKMIATTTHEDFVKVGGSRIDGDTKEKLTAEGSRRAELLGLQSCLAMATAAGLVAKHMGKILKFFDALAGGGNAITYDTIRRVAGGTHDSSGKEVPPHIYGGYNAKGEKTPRYALLWSQQEPLFTEGNEKADEKRIALMKKHMEAYPAKYCDLDAYIHETFRNTMEPECRGYWVQFQGSLPSELTGAMENNWGWALKTLAEAEMKEAGKEGGNWNDTDWKIIDPSLCPKTQSIEDELEKLSTTPQQVNKQTVRLYFLRGFTNDGEQFIEKIGRYYKTITGNDL